MIDEHLQTLPLKGFDKVDEFADPELLPLTTLTRLENGVLDVQGGKVLKRNGFYNFNTHSAGAGVYSLKDCINSLGVNYVVGVIDTKIRMCPNGTGVWADLISGMTSNAKINLASYNGKFFITNGIQPPFVTDLLASPSTWDLLLSAPTVSSVTTTLNAGGSLLPNATYYYVVVYVTDAGELSPPSAWIIHYANSAPFNKSTYTGNQSITLNNLPISADTRVVSRLLFRTKGDDNVPYLLTRLDNASTSYTDEAPDTSLDLSQTVTYSQAVNTCKYLTVHRERLFLGYLGLTDIAPKMIQAKAGNGVVFAGVAATASGSLTAGAYSYRVIFVDSNNFVSGYIQANVTLTGGNNSVNLFSIPQSFGLGVEARVYRTKVNGSIYYFLGSNLGSYYTDNIADAALGAVIPSATSSSTTYTSGLMWSEIGKPSQILAESLMSVYPDDTDLTTGLVDDEDGLIIFKQNSICKILTLGADNPLQWQPKKLVNQMGSDQPLSIQKGGQQKIYFMKNKQVFRYPDKLDIPLSNPKRVTLNTLTAVNDSAYISSLNWYVIIITCTSTKYVMIYDEKLDCWYQFSASALSFESIIEKKFGTYMGYIVIGHSVLTVLSEYDSTVDIDYDGVTSYEIVPYVKTKTFNSKNDPDALFRLRKLYANYKKKDGQTVNHTISNPEDTGLTITTADTTNATLSSDYKSFKIETDRMTGTLKTTNKLIYQIDGAGLKEFNAAKILYRDVNRGQTT